jgi:hypothetical protein
MPLIFPPGPPLTPYVDQSAPSAPGLPISVVATAQNASANVQWTFPRSVAISSYLITASPGGATQTVSAASNSGSVNFTGLSNGTAYTFTVQAISNFGGKSVVIGSAVSNSVTPTALPSATLPVYRNLEFWWSARQVTGVTNGATLAQLTDFSGNGYNATPYSSGGTWVSSWVGGQPAVALNGTSQLYTTTPAGLVAGQRSSKCTVAAVFDCTANPNGDSVLNGRIVSHEGLNLLYKVGQAFGVGGTASQVNVAAFDNTLGFSTAILNGGTIALSTATTLIATMPGSVYVNGSSIGSGMSPVVAATAQQQFQAASVNVTGGWTFGARENGSSNTYMTGHLAELIVYYDVLTSGEISSLQTYLTGAY